MSSLNSSLIILCLVIIAIASLSQVDAKRDRPPKKGNRATKDSPPDDMPKDMDADHDKDLDKTTTTTTTAAPHKDSDGGSTTTTTTGKPSKTTTTKSASPASHDDPDKRELEKMINDINEEKELLKKYDLAFKNWKSWVETHNSRTLNRYLAKKLSFMHEKYLNQVTRTRLIRPFNRAPTSATNTYRGLHSVSMDI